MDTKVEKFQWSEKDFDQMGWHDSHIYALAFDDEDFKLVLDIDYILKWVDPIENETYFKFWVAPATLVFKRVRDLKVAFEGPFIEIDIEDIDREEVKGTKIAESNWMISTGIGSISFKAVGFDQFIRRTPTLISTQKIGLGNRGGISFAEVAFDE